MPATFGKPTTLTDVLAAIKGRVASALGLSADYVFTALDLKQLEEVGGPADTFAVVTNPRGRIDQGAVAGGGEDNLLVYGSVEVQLWNRAEADENYKDTADLESAALGILAKWRLLLKRGAGLQMFYPDPSPGTQTTFAEPMRVLDFEARPRTAAVGWTKLVSRWEVQYVEDTTT